jgi:uncharacterized protein (DUF2236 family)
MLDLTEPIRRDDYGFFGPGSPSWKVWASPTALIGFQRSVVLEHFDPFLAAAVADSAGIYADPRGRLDRTLAYFLTVAVADGRTAVGVSDALMRIHAKATGIEPITGARYSANNPDAQLWIHVTGWHSVLKCYERFGPGPLTKDEETRYWGESRIAAELQTCKPSDVPSSRDEVRQYFADVRSKLCTSEHADRAMHYLLWTPRDRGIRLWAGSRLLAPAAIATLPKWMRHMGGFRPARRRRRRRDADGTGGRPCHVGRQLAVDADCGARAGAEDRRGPCQAPGSRAAPGRVHGHAVRGAGAPSRAGRSRVSD